MSTEEGAKAKKGQVDWERVESLYRAGLLSVREIAAAHGVSHTAIQKRAKSDGWERDLTAKIKAKADSLVAKREVAKQVAAERAATDTAVVEANAEVIAGIRMAHRTDIARSRSLAMALLAELEAETGEVELYQQLGDLLRAPDENGMDKLNDLYRKVIGLPSRVDSAKKLAESLRHLIGLEREAYGLTVDPSAGAPQAPSGLGHFYGES